MDSDKYWRFSRSAGASVNKILKAKTSSKYVGGLTKSPGKRIPFLNAKITKATTLKSDKSRMSSSFDSLLEALCTPQLCSPIIVHKPSPEPLEIVSEQGTSRPKPDKSFKEILSQLFSSSSSLTSDPVQSPVNEEVDLEFSEILDRLCSQSPIKSNSIRKMDDDDTDFPEILSQLCTPLEVAPEGRIPEVLSQFSAAQLPESRRNKRDTDFTNVLVTQHKLGRPLSTEPAAELFDLLSVSQVPQINQLDFSVASYQSRASRYSNTRYDFRLPPVGQPQIAPPAQPSFVTKRNSHSRKRAVKRKKVNPEYIPQIKNPLDCLVPKSQNSQDSPSQGAKLIISNVATEDWLQAVYAEIIDFHPMEQVEILADYTNLCVDNNKTSVTFFRKGSVRIFRIQKQFTLVKKQFDADRFFEKLTQSFSQSTDGEDSLFVEQVASPKSVPSSYVLNFTGKDTTLSGDLMDPSDKFKLGMNDICRNKELVVNYEEVEVDRSKVMNMIQDVFSKLFEAFRNNQAPSLKFRRRTWKNCIFNDDRLQLLGKNNVSTLWSQVTVKRTPSYRNFFLMLYLMAKIYTLLRNDTKLTKREVFYQIKGLVRNQNQVNRAIDNICCFLNVGPWHLNLVSHCGLIYGKLELVLSSGEIINCNIPGTMIPYDFELVTEVRSSAFFILVVEKESIFHKLLEEDLPNKLVRPFIMITGKGVPDLNTQLFLKKICGIIKRPVFILVDADPAGIKIMLTYRYGSLNSAYLSEYLAVPNARWLGVFPSEVVKFGIKRTELSATDRKVAESLIASPMMKAEPRFAIELNYLLTNNIKANIEGLIKNHTFLSESYLPNKFFHQDFF